MMRTTDWRICKRGLPLALLVSIGVGCQPSKPVPGEAFRETTDKSPTLSVAANEAPSKPPEPKLADDFLKALSEGKIKNNQVGMDFCKRIARPLSEDDRARGFSELSLQSYLSRLTKATYKVNQSRSISQGAESFFHGEALLDGKMESFSLHVSKGSTGEPVLEWFHRTTVLAPQITPATTTEGIKASEKARAFLDTLLGGDLTLTEATMTTALKATLADPLSTDKDIGYNPTFLHLKLKGWKGDFTTYQLSVPQESDGTAIFTVVLRGTNDLKQEVTLKTIKEKGVVLVNDWKAK